MKNLKWFNWLGISLIVFGIIFVILGVISGVGGELIAGVLLVASSISLITYKKPNKKEDVNNPKTQ
jgi:hypothetical protein